MQMTNNSRITSQTTAKSFFAYGLFLFVCSFISTSSTAEEKTDPCKTQQQNCIEENELHFGLSIGMGLRTNPLFQSDNIPLILLPQLSFYSGDFFFENLDFGYNLYQSENTSFGLLATPSYDTVFFKRWDLGNVFVSQASSSEMLLPSDSDNSAERQPQINPDQLSKREFSYLGGVEYNIEFKQSLIQLSLLTDLTNTHSGSEIRFAYAHRLSEYFSTTLGFTWKDKNLTDYYYGIDASEANSSDVYQAGASFSPFLRASYNLDLDNGDNWRASLEYQKLASQISSSPILDDDYVVTFFVGKTFRF